MYHLTTMTASDWALFFHVCAILRDSCMRDFCPLCLPFLQERQKLLGTDCRKKINAFEFMLFPSASFLVFRVASLCVCAIEWEVCECSNSPVITSLQLLYICTLTAAVSSTPKGLSLKKHSVKPVANFWQIYNCDPESHLLLSAKNRISSLCFLHDARDLIPERLR